MSEIQSTTPAESVPNVTETQNKESEETTKSNTISSTNDLEELETIIRAKLIEGQGETLFDIIGPEDTGLSNEDFDNYVKNLKIVTEKCQSEMIVASERNVKDGKIGEALIRETKEETYVDVRYAVCGNVDSGKSTMIGVLTRGKLDNGRGLMRANVFTHKHEATTGRTSAISQQILGFSVKGDCIDYSSVHGTEWGEILEKSYKVVSFIDLAGHEKYLKTTVSGMTGQMPDYCLLLIGANMGVTRMTKEHLGLALALKIPIIVLITKIDIAPENIMKQTLADIQKILKMRGVKKIALQIKNEEDLMVAIKSISFDRLVPIFFLSNVTGENLDLLKKFLNLAPRRIQWSSLISKPPEVLIDQTYFVTGVGTVVGGTVMSGSVTANQNMLLGPDGNDQFIPVQIKSVHSKRVPVKQVSAGQSCGVAIKKIKRSTIRRGMALVDPSLNPKASWIFEADIVILYHSTTIHLNYQPVIQCMTMRQSARIIKIVGKDLLRTGDRATVRFKFLYHTEYMKVGMRIIFREGRCKGIGIISAINIEVEKGIDQAPEEKEKEKQTNTSTQESPNQNT